MVNEHFSRRLWMGFGVIMVAVVIAAGALYFFAGDLSANADAIMSARAALNQENTAVADLASLKQQATQAAAYQTAMDQLIPDQYGLVTFTQWFAQQGTQYNVSATADFQGAITPSNGTQPGTAMFTFSATGSLADISSFLSAAARQSPQFLVAFSSFNVTSASTGYTITGGGTVFSR